MYVDAASNVFPTVLQRVVTELQLKPVTVEIYINGSCSATKAVIGTFYLLKLSIQTSHPDKIYMLRYIMFVE